MTDGTEFAKKQTGALLERLERYAAEVAADPNAEAVHDLRVTVRRVKSALRVFRTVFAGREVKRVKRKLDGVMEAAGAVRDRDVVIELMEKAGARAGVVELARERDRAREELREAAGKMEVGKWRRKLGV